MSYEVPRRVHIYKHFSRIGRNCWPPQRDEVLQKSKFALNVHQDNHPFCEPLRFALFAAYGLPVLSEFVYDSKPYSKETMAFATYDDLVVRMNQMLRDDYEPWRQMGLRMRKLMTEEYEFGKVVREAVSQTVGEWR